VKHARIVHGPLQRISLPPKHVIRMCPVPLKIYGQFYGKLCRLERF
jgi:hypothetical protein